MENSNRLAVVVGMLTLATCGCAHVEVKHVGINDKSEGVHFYEPRPYLLVAKTVTDKGVSYTSSIVYLPNLEQRYTVRVKQGWGTVNGSIKLMDGWRLDTLGAQTDSKGPETINSVTGLLTSAAGIALKSSAEEPTGLYLIDVRPSGEVELIHQKGWKSN